QRLVTLTVGSKENAVQSIAIVKGCVKDVTVNELMAEKQKIVVLRQRRVKVVELIEVVPVQLGDILSRPRIRDQRDALLHCRRGQLRSFMEFANPIEAEHQCLFQLCEAGLRPSQLRLGLSKSGSLLQ